MLQFVDSISCATCVTWAVRCKQNDYLLFPPLFSCPSVSFPFLALLLSCPSLFLLWFWALGLLSLVGFSSSPSSSSFLPCCGLFLPFLPFLPFLLPRFLGLSSFLSSSFSSLLPALFLFLLLLSSPSHCSSFLLFLLSWPFYRTALQHQIDTCITFLMVIMDRSRSPVRPPNQEREPNNLVGFPIWTHPMGSGVPAPPPRQFPSNFPLSQQRSGTTTPQEIPLSQQSMMIPPGQPGMSQPMMEPSQTTMEPSQPCASPMPMWRPPKLHVTPPRPGLQGKGMAGMGHNVPLPPPSWGQQGFNWPKPNQFGQNTPTPPRMSNKKLPHQVGNHHLVELQPFNKVNIGNLMKSSMTHRKSTAFLYLEWSAAPAGVNSKTSKVVIHWLSLLANYYIKEVKTFGCGKLATGREVYVATMGEVSQVVFVSEILAQIRGRGIDLDRLAQHKYLQDGNTGDKKEAIQHLTKLVDQMQKWLPVVQADSGSQHQIAALQAEIAELKAKAGQVQQHETPGVESQPSPPTHRVPSPIEAALQGQRPVAFDPAQLLVTPGSTNQWLENNMPEAFSDSKYKSWFKGLKLDITSRQTIERNIVAMDNWWQNQPDTAETTIHRVAVMPWYLSWQDQVRTEWEPPESDDSGLNYDLVRDAEQLLELCHQPWEGDSHVYFLTQNVQVKRNSVLAASKYLHHLHFLLLFLSSHWYMCYKIAPSNLAAFWLYVNWCTS